MLQGSRCAACGRTSVPPEAACIACGAATREHAVEQRGRALAVTRLADARTVVLVELEGAARLMALSDVGLGVGATGTVRADGRLPRFSPDHEGG